MDYKSLNKNDSQRYTLGEVYVPNEVDSQGDYAEASEIEKACWDYMERLQTPSPLTKSATEILDAVINADGKGVTLDVTDACEVIKSGLNDMHVEQNEPVGRVVENYITPTDFELNGQDIKKGTWMLGVVWTPEYFEKIKSGERTGFSMEGRGIRIAE